MTELTEGETGDSVRFHVPANVGCRYGDEPSTGKVAPPASTGDTFFSVDVKIESAAPISKVNCPSHAVSTELGPDPSLPDAANLPFANYARVTCRSNLALSSDFVVEITSTGLDRPRCVVERHPTQDSAAISLTVVPRFKLDELTGQEYVFLVDRSGSMGDWGSTAAGGRISLARKALVILLRALPSRDTVFNIVSFGSSHEVLWSKGSRAYNQVRHCCRQSLAWAPTDPHLAHRTRSTKRRGLSTRWRPTWGAPRSVRPSTRSSNSATRSARRASLS